MSREGKQDWDKHEKGEYEMVEQEKLHKAKELRKEQEKEEQELGEQEKEEKEKQEEPVKDCKGWENNIISFLIVLYWNFINLSNSITKTQNILNIYKIQGNLSSLGYSLLAWKQSL